MLVSCRAPLTALRFRLCPTQGIGVRVLRDLWHALQSGHRNHLYARCCTLLLALRGRAASSTSTTWRKQPNVLNQSQSCCWHKRAYMMCLVLCAVCSMLGSATSSFSLFLINWAAVSGNPCTGKKPMTQASCGLACAVEGQQEGVCSTRCRQRDRLKMV